MIVVCVCVCSTLVSFLGDSCFAHPVAVSAIATIIARGLLLWSIKSIPERMKRNSQAIHVSEYDEAIASECEQAEHR